MQTLTITVLSGKGGTGKTLVSTAMAYLISQKEKTHIIDADIECPNDHLLLGFERTFKESIFHPIPKFDMSKCIKCGKCSEVCKQNSIVFIKNKHPGFISDTCIGCMACKHICPTGAIQETKKEIGKIFEGKKNNLNLISGELILGELASGEVVASVRKYAENKNISDPAAVTIIDASAGIGCPVIASVTGSDYVVMVAEPTPSALHDLKRAHFLADHFKIPCGLIVNKCNLESSFFSKILEFTKEKNIPLIGKIPFNNKILKASVKPFPIENIIKAAKKDFNKILDFLNLHVIK